MRKLNRLDRDLIAVALLFGSVVLGGNNIYQQSQIKKEIVHQQNFLKQVKKVVVDLDQENTVLHAIIQEQDKYSIKLEKKIHEFESSDKLIKDVVKRQE